MNISSYADLLTAAGAQPQPQRMLFAFARAERPDAQSGALTPVMCVDKTLDQLGTFDALVDESRHMGAHWDIVFVSSMSGRAGAPPPSSQAQPLLDRMVSYIHTGEVGSLLAFDRQGQLLDFAVSSA